MEDEYGIHVHPHTHQGYGLAKLEIHLDNYPHPDGTEDWEPHDHPRKIKEASHYSDRIDIHPWAKDRLPKADVVFFGIEGCPKADSMLQNIIDLGINASVMSVPAIGMWNAPELPQVAKHILQRKTVVIVPDGDWAYNEQVENQARVFQARLMEYGVRNVFIAAPPVEETTDEDGNISVHAPRVWYEPGQKWEELKGVDDFLGLSNSTLADLICINRRVQDPADIRQWVLDHLSVSSRQQAYRRDYIQKLVNVITALSLCSGDGGQIRLTVNMLANYMNLHPRSISNYLKELESIGAVSIRGSLLMNRNFFGATDWAAINKPVITLHEDLRSTPESRTLGETIPSLFERQEALV